MDNLSQTKITLVVHDEEDLYTSFSPGDEFDDSVKKYIRSKIVDENNKEGIYLSVVSDKPINEEKFLAAVANWTKEEKKKRKIEEKRSFRMLLGLLAVASLMIIVSLSLEKYNNLLKYSILPVMSSLALSRAAAILLIDMPSMRASKWIFQEMEKRNVVSFEYDKAE